MVADEVDEGVQPNAPRGRPAARVEAALGLGEGTGDLRAQVGEYAGGSEQFGEPGAVASGWGMTREQLIKPLALGGLKALVEATQGQGLDAGQQVPAMAGGVGRGQGQLMEVILELERQAKGIGDGFEAGTVKGVGTGEQGAEHEWSGESVAGGLEAVGAQDRICGDGMDR